MPNIYLKTTLSLFILMSLQPLTAQAPVIHTATPLATTVEQYGKFEVQLDLTATYTNPYDYDDIRVFATFLSPDNQAIIVDGFFIQDFQFSNLQTGALSPTNTGVFKIRFSPIQIGTWRYTISCTAAAGTGIFVEQILQCVPTDNSSNKGFIRVSESNYLKFDNQSQYIPIGENLAWQVSNPYLDYKKWLDKLSANQGNFFRIWQAYWGLGIEWKNNTNGFSGLRRYKQSNAFYLDWLFDYCAEKGVYVMFCLHHHGQVSSKVNPNWNENPYNAANGGPAQNTWDFFTNLTAKNHVKNRLRYIMARWGYSRNIMSWELFNEVDWTDQFAQRKTDVANWHVEMAAFLKENDPCKHLVTTSFAQEQNDPAVWHQPDIDFTQTHFYSNISNLERPLSKLAKKYMSTFQKPTLVAEFGLGHSADELSTLDPTGIYIHNALWASLFSGAMGTAMTWWWDNYIEPQNLYHHFLSVSKIIAQIAFKADRFKPTSAIVKGAPSNLQLFPSLGWGALADVNFNIDNQGVVIPENARLSSYLYGNQSNVTFRRPPVFNVHYPAKGKFVIKTADRTSSRPKIAIWLDGVKKLEKNAAIHKSYSIDIPAGKHTIKVDNSGSDWISISAYTFTGLGAAVDAYTLVSEDRSKLVGWVLNHQYNHEFIKKNGIPAAVLNATLVIENIKSGSYLVKWLDCKTGKVFHITTIIIENNQLNLLIPNLLWDLAFILEPHPVDITV